jgi:hypothetical protein
VQYVNRELLRLLADINESLLLELIVVLQPFDTATKCLSSDSKPTLHLVAPTRLQLMKTLTPAVTDSTIIGQLKRHLGGQLARYFTVSQLHHTATLLDPRLKNNNELMSEEARQQAVIGLRQLVNAVPDIEDQQTVQEDAVAPSAKKMKVEDNFYASLFASTSPSTANEVCSCHDSISILVFLLLCSVRHIINNLYVSIYM